VGGLFALLDAVFYISRRYFGGDFSWSLQASAPFKELFEHMGDRSGSSDPSIEDFFPNDSGTPR
jgi:hypothetical protein